MKIYCFECGKPVTNEVPDSTIFRAIATCPECIAIQEERISKLVDEMSNEAYLAGIGIDTSDFDESD